MFIRSDNYKPFQILAISWLVFITIVSGVPDLKVPNVFPQADKLVHIVIFAILAFLLAGSIHKYIRHKKKISQIILVLLLTTMFGFLDEWHQSTVIGRVSSQWDLLADVIGGFVGVILFSLVQSKR